MNEVCPYCRGLFEAADDRKVCEACATPHHKDCFLENGGCTVFGCEHAPGDEPKIRIAFEDLDGDAGLPGYANTAGAGAASRAFSPRPGEEIPGLRQPRNARFGADEPEPLWVQTRPALAAHRGFPGPPRLPWAILVALCILTLGFYIVIWELVLAHWMRKVEPRSRAIYYFGAVAVLCLLAFASEIGALTNDSQAIGMPLLEVSAFVLVIMGRFSMRKSLEEFFDEAGPIGLSLSEGMTFFFGCIYFQCNLNRVMRQKEQRHALA